MRSAPFLAVMLSVKLHRQQANYLPAEACQSRVQASRALRQAFTTCDFGVHWHQTPGEPGDLVRDARQVHPVGEILVVTLIRKQRGGRALTWCRCCCCCCGWHWCFQLLLRLLFFASGAASRWGSLALLCRRRPSLDTRRLAWDFEEGINVIFIVAVRGSLMAGRLL